MLSPQGVILFPNDKFPTCMKGHYKVAEAHAIEPTALGFQYEVFYDLALIPCQVTPPTPLPILQFLLIKANCRKFLVCLKSPSLCPAQVPSSRNLLELQAKKSVHLLSSHSAPWTFYHTIPLITLKYDGMTKANESLRWQQSRARV